MKHALWLALSAGTILSAGTMLAAPALADEGMWLPSQTGQIAEKMKATGLEMDPGKLGDFKAPPLNAIVSPWFVRKRPAALGLAYNGGSIGGVIFSPRAGKPPFGHTND